ncbi:MAG: MBOAT family protein [Clostridiales bacterium]|jgi:D-alanyl-lipoteichoic acid acyltransferase DltB (MBOAT superfamily)|nr:MBOAT family protein [Clostridiales bacterium]
MYFTSANFLLFFLCTFVGYYTVFRRVQWQFLLMASLVFYAFSGWSNLIYICVTICSTWFAGRQMTRLRIGQEQYLAGIPELSKKGRNTYKAVIKAKLKKWLVLCLLFNLAILAVVKYISFVISSINPLLSVINAQQITSINILLPLGISFYTFQALSYIIDVYRGLESESSLFKFGLFVSFFPQLIQGPISRFDDLKETLYSQHKFDSEEFQAGLARVMWGFFKKLIVADRLITAVMALSDPNGGYGGVYVILNAFFYAITLYADFTGGIDITLGTARMLGVAVKENFSRPFYSVSIADYWRQWHITMGTWFKDYLFYPISASRPMLRLFKWSQKSFGGGFGKRISVYTSTMILWFVTGLWHGAEWHFIVWGLVNGIVIIISKELSPLYARFHKRFRIGDTNGYKAFQIFRTFWLMSFIRIFDVYGSVRLTIKMYLSVIFNFDWTRFITNGPSDLGLDIADYALIAIAVIVMVIAGFTHNNRHMEFTNVKPILRTVLIASMVFAVIIFGIYGFGYDSRQFIYNQF